MDSINTGGGGQVKHKKLTNGQTLTSTNIQNYTVNQRSDPKSKNKLW